MVAELIFLTILSVLSLAPVAWILNQPCRPTLQPVNVPTVLYDVPDVTFDWIGLV